MAKDNQGNRGGGGQGGSHPPPKRGQGGGSGQGSRPPQQGGARPRSKEVGLDEALDALLVQDWFRVGVAEMLANVLEAPSAPPAIRDWLRQQLSRIMAEGDEERRDTLESWAAEAQEMQQMVREFQGQQQDLQQQISDEQRYYDALRGQLK